MSGDHQDSSTGHAVDWRTDGVRVIRGDQLDTTRRRHQE